MLLYDCEHAPSPRRVRIFAAEKGISLNTVQVDLAHGEQMSDEFRRRNPECTVPVLELEDGTCISEVLAICDYLEQTKLEPQLMGRNAKLRAQVLMWNAKIEQNGLAAVTEFFRNSAKGLRSRASTGPTGLDQIPEIVERGRRRGVVFFKRLDSHLDHRQFIAGESTSIADITALVAVDFATRAKPDFLERSAQPQTLARRSCCAR